MTAVPIRLRLTAVFALATLVVLAGAGWFVHQRLQEDLDESVTAALQARVASAMPVAGDPEETLAQVLDASGRVIEPPGQRAALTPSEVRKLGGGALVVERSVAGVEGTTRLLARRAGDDRIVVAGQSLDDRDETLSQLVGAFAVGGPLAVLLASLLGYALARTALAPVEEMRRRSEQVARTERLPLPRAHDELRRLAQTLNSMLDRLQDSYDRERRFVSDASHELRTPIAVIKTELEAALRAGDVTPDARAALRAAADECDHLAQLAEDLLVLARSGEGRLALRRERLDAREVLEGARERFASRASEHGRRIAVTGDAVVDADPQRLRQALGNLVDNSLRHGTGTVSLHAGVEGESTVLTVGDGGAGLRDEGLFERFAVGAARSRDGGGSGLGLAIVRAIAEAHDGRAELRGGKVAIVLPSQAGLSERA